MNQVLTYDVDGSVHKSRPVVVSAVWQVSHGGPAVVTGVELLHQACLQFHLGMEGVHAANGQNDVRAGRDVSHVLRLCVL